MVVCLIKLTIGALGANYQIFLWFFLFTSIFYACYHIRVYMGRKGTIYDFFYPISPLTAALIKMDILHFYGLMMPWHGGDANDCSLEYLREGNID